MICAQCIGETPDRPCAACGGEPLLFGRFRYEQRLGTGRSGTTWKATDVGSGRIVACKDVPLALASDKQVELVEREVRVLRQLDHPAIPRYIAHGVEGNRRTRRLVIVETFVPGVPLRAPASEDEVLDVLESLADILEYLHELRPPVVHRDVKPANVLRDGRTLYLLDFGSVRDALPGTIAGSTVTGTFGYMAPEQFRGEAEPASDWYGAGALAWWMLTGIEPRARMGHTSADFAWKEGTNASPAMIALLEGLLEPDPALRVRDHATVRLLVRAARWRAPLGADAGVLASLYADLLSLGTATRLRERPRRHPATDLAVLAAAQLAWILPLAGAFTLWRWW